MKIVLTKQNKPILIGGLLETIHFKHWIENTQLFNSIKQQSISNYMGTPSLSGKSEYIIRAYNPDGSLMELNMKEGKLVSGAEDLPDELLVEFFRNSPFYSEVLDFTITEKIQKLIHE